MRRLYLGTFVAAWMSQLLTPVFAINDTIGVTAGAGKTANLIAFSGGNVISEVGICDATTANQCAAVSAGGALSVSAAQSGTWNVTNISGTVSLPTGAATAALQTTINTTLGTPMQSSGGSVTANAGTNLNTSALATQTTLASVLSTLGSPMQTSGGSVTANAGTNLNTSALGTSANQSTIITALTTANGHLATIDTNSGSPIPAGTNSIGAVTNTTLGTATDSPCSLPATGSSCTDTALQKAMANAINSPPPLGTANGWTPLKIAALTNTAVAVKAAAGQLAKLYCYNPNSSVAYIQVYNVAAGSVTVGTTAALQSYGVPPVSSAGFIMALVGDQYSTAISVAATTTAGGGTAPSTAMDCNASYN